MTTASTFLSATPVLASLDIKRSISFLQTKLGFAPVHVEPGVYGITTREQVSIHFWPCKDKAIAESTSCRVQVTGIAALYERCKAERIVHPNAPLENKPWGNWEFGILDPDGNLITFYEAADA